MPKLVGVGHNTVDKYMSHNMMYPGGNEVNVAALSSRYGISSSYVGWVGTDIYGQLIIDALKAEKVDLSHCHIKEGVNTYTEIFLEDGERSFGNIRRGIGTKRETSQEDRDFILTHEPLHTGFYSNMEEFIEQYHDQITISFDFTGYAEREYINAYLPLIDIAFLSGQNHDNIEESLQSYHSSGPKLVVMTMGKQGSYLYNGELFYKPPITLDQVVDTLGAGDSFISRFLVDYINSTAPKKVLQQTTKAAARTCQYYGAFGDGIETPEEES